MAQSVDIKFIEKAEAELGVSLPNWYRVSMQSLNGGSVSFGGEAWELYPILDLTNKKSIRKTGDNLVLNQKSAQDWPGFPSNAIAIGENGTGDHIVLLILDGGIADTRVYHWLHETGKCIDVTNA
ncbi:SMI1/KNR4 family protein [Amphritea balenae]|uniref:SMI1/KNR4 family protein n=1 Tax=Amphritea balenae TaxID=452629 RepID=A0A3P1SLK7_9GAMM|nr:SMI1/KNR4 family protein [Amphritea balenae]RRC98016.1 SMI1/KNR4 family protein [Amphritea balenae]GGK66789.1 hypothetical protein GCM10007941_16140 [Amphritea balenae]